MLPEVLTVHGVGIFGSRGPWQASVDRVLSPHFQCTSIRYSHYRWLGLFTAFIEPWFLVPGLLLVFALRAVHAVHVIWPWVLVVVLLSFAAARVRHALCLRNFLDEYQRTTHLGIRPHVIAHSMGTKLLGTVLYKYPQVRLANVVLAGCVLPVDYPWHALVQSNSHRFGFVRNEVGLDDWVPELAGLGAKVWLLPGYGSAGSRGFTEVTGLIHTVSSLSFYCAKCVFLAAAVAIHNVVLNEFEHGSVFDPGYAASFWLPFLWSIDPGEYTTFLESCFSAAYHHEMEDWPAYALIEQEMLDRNWGWAGKRTLRDYIIQVAEKYPQATAQTQVPVGQILRKLWQDVVIASRAHQERKGGWETEIRALHPVTAVVRSGVAITG